MKKIALIGAGKTGSHVSRLTRTDEVVKEFTSTDKPTVKSLMGLDAAIIFVPGDAAEELIAPLLKAGIPSVWGTTGFAWPADLPERVKVSGSRWVLASNFSLGMSLVRRCLQLIGKGSSILDDPTFLIHEVHHKDKKDKPSGTAIKWEEWLGLPDVQISSKREGDVKGIHTLQVKTRFETITLKHEAHDRAVFARGALWAARYLIETPNLMSGVYSFESLVDRELMDPHE